jgi:probable phosphoglycerate mutase
VRQSFAPVFVLAFALTVLGPLVGGRQPSAQAPIAAPVAEARQPPAPVSVAPATTATLRIYVARHGESTSNVAGVTTGWTDAPLTARGRRQARDLAASLRGTAFDAIYSSTSSRSRDTAQTVANGRRVQALPALRERNWGRFTGRPGNDPEFLRRRAADNDDLDGGETRQAFYERVRGAVAEVRRQHPAGTVLIVAHGATNQQVLRALLGLTADQAEMVIQGNDEVYAVDFFPGRMPLLWKMIRAANLGDL